MKGGRFFLYLFFFGCSSSWATEQESVQRIEAHLALHDATHAVAEGEEAFSLYPSSICLWESLIHALADAGEEKRMLAIWNEKKEVFTDPALQRRVMETMAWGVIHKAYLSSSPVLRLHALVGGVVGQDVLGVNLLLRGLKDEQLLLRLVAVELAGNLRDDRLKKEIRRMIKEEKHWEIRFAALEAAGKMQLHDLESTLTAIIADEETSAEEKAVASEALVNMVESMSVEEVSLLAQSPRSGLRILACLIVSHCALLESLPDIVQLTDDPNGEVRAAALQTLGSLHPSEEIFSLAEKWVHDTHPLAGISAAWLSTLCGAERGVEAFVPWVEHEVEEVRVFAAAALASTGRLGWPLGKVLLRKTKDPMVRLNLAVGFLPYRYEVEELSRQIFALLQQQEARWTVKKWGLFSAIVPLQKGGGGGFVSPEEINQMTRLRLLNLLAIVGSPEAHQAFLHFLETRQWNLSRLAATLLLTEGDEEAVKCVEKLLEHENAHIRLEAALIVAMWGREESVLQQLQKAYPTASREMKEKILEALGRVGEMMAAPFFVDCLSEQHQSLRVMAATSLLQCLEG